MNELVKERPAEALVEVDEEFGETSQNDASMLKIVSNIETRMIQEGIQKKWEKHDEIKRSWKDYTVSASAVALTSLTLISIILTRGNIPGILIPVIFLALCIGIPMSILGLPAISDRVKYEQHDVYQQIEHSRIELAEKSLNIEILKKDQTTITEEWDEVMALDENDDYVKILMRVVKDETTGFETIQSKMLKNQ